MAKKLGLNSNRIGNEGLLLMANNLKDGDYGIYKEEIAKELIKSQDSEALEDKDEILNQNDNRISDAGLLMLANNSEVDGDEFLRQWVKLCNPVEVRMALEKNKDELGLDNEKIDEIVKQLYKDKYGMDEEELNENIGISLREHYRDRTGLTYNEKQQILKGHEGELGLDDEEIEKKIRKFKIIGGRNKGKNKRI